MKGLVSIFLSPSSIIVRFDTQNSYISRSFLMINSFAATSRGTRFDKTTQSICFTFPMWCFKVYTNCKFYSQDKVIYYSFGIVLERASIVKLIVISLLASSTKGSSCVVSSLMIIKWSSGISPSTFLNTATGYTLHCFWFQCSDYFLR